MRQITDLLQRQIEILVLSLLRQMGKFVLSLLRQVGTWDICAVPAKAGRDV